MKILLTGATGYIGKRILPLLIENNHQVVCCVRDKNRFSPPKSLQTNIEVVECDLIDKKSLNKIPNDIQAAYYLVHSMSTHKDYMSFEQKCAENFKNRIEQTTVSQVIYLSGIVNENNLSKHLSSRKKVEIILNSGKYNFTCLRAGIIVGSGSASFEIIRDLVEKLPLMITPRWLHTKCQPIAIRDVQQFLIKSLLNPKTYNQNFDIGSNDILTYKEMLLQFAAVRNLKRTIITLPVMTPKLSSYWLYFVTSTSYKLATSLVDSMKVEVVCRDNKINELLGIVPISYTEAIEKAFLRIESNAIISSWKDSYASSGMNININDFINIPQYGCFRDSRKKSFNNFQRTVENIWKLGGDKGWYYGNFLWRIRGFLDKLVGGVGLRRGRTHPTEINPGDALDFWRVLYANKKEGRLLLFAEMKLPGEAWLEFRITNNQLHQNATFRPKGVFGRLYWYAVLPFHGFIFKGMLKNLVEK